MRTTVGITVTRSIVSLTSVDQESSPVQEALVFGTHGAVMGTTTAETGQMRPTVLWVTIRVRAVVSSVTLVTVFLSAGSVTEMTTARMAQTRTLRSVEGKSAMASYARMAPVCLQVLTAMVLRTVQVALMSKTVVHSVHTIWSLCAEIERSVCFSLWFVTGPGTVLMVLMRTPFMLDAPLVLSLRKHVTATTSSAPMGCV